MLYGETEYKLLDSNGKKYYSKINSFLKKYGFEYRQHSGDVSTYKMQPSYVIRVLDDLFAAYPDMEKFTKSCFFTSVNESYSFTKIREKQLKTEPNKSEFTITLEIKQSDIENIFNTTNPNVLDRNFRNLFTSPLNLKAHMEHKIDKKPNEFISITWTSDMAISSLDKTIAINNIFKNYPALLNHQQDVTLEMKYDEHTTDLIAEQQRIMSEEKKRLVEYDMSTLKLGKDEYDKLNNALKKKLFDFGLQHTQESGWISKNGMTDEQIQAVLTDLFQNDCGYDEITDVMDISTVNGKTYDYMEIVKRRNSSNNNQGQGSSSLKKSKEYSTQSKADAISRERYSQLPDNFTKDDLQSDNDDDFKF